MTTNTQIAIFNKEWQSVAFVSANALQVLNFCDEQDKSLLAWVLDQLKERDPQLMEPVKDESGCITGFLSVGKGEPRYLEAVRDELKRVGLRAYEVPDVVVPLLIQTSENPVFNHIRLQIVPEILGLDAEHAKTALQAVIDTASS